MGTGNRGPSGCGMIVPTFYFLRYMTQQKKLEIFIDESGNCSAFSKENPIYSVALVMVETEVDNVGPINKFNHNLSSLVGGNHFVHVGNLIRGEKPYTEMQREERWKLFYALYLFAFFAKYKVVTATIEKCNTADSTLKSIAKALLETIKAHVPYMNGFDKIVIHYDYGQSSLSGIITASFLSFFSNSEIVKTAQSETPFMQLSDLYAYFELLKYKISKGHLTKSETSFFGGTNNLKKNYIKSLESKYMH